MKSLNILIVLIFFSNILSAQSTIDYNDVVVIVNDNSQVSIDIGNYFQNQRDIPELNMIHISTTTSEEVDSLEFENIRQQIEAYMIDNDLVADINYMVTTKGVPLKVDRGTCFFNGILNDCASFDSELTLILGNLNGSIGDFLGTNNPYFNSGTHFNVSEYGIYLVTRLDGYTYEDVINLIDRSGPNKTVSQSSSIIVFDLSFIDSTILGLFTNLMQETVDAVSLDGWTTTFHPDSSLLVEQQNVLGYHGINYQPADKVLNNHWLEGSIAELSEAFSSATFDTAINVDNYLLIADLIAEGATGAHGSIYISTVSLSLNSKTLFKYYTDTTSNYNLAESYYMSIPKLSWQSVVIGDPKTSILVDNIVSSINLDNKNGISVYPNPSKGHFVFELNNSHVENVEIINQLGEQVFVKKNVLPTGAFSINMSNQAAGIYFVQWEDDKELVTKKIVITK